MGYLFFFREVQCLLTICQLTVWNLSLQIPGPDVYLPHCQILTAHRFLAFHNFLIHVGRWYIFLLWEKYVTSDAWGLASHTWTVYWLFKLFKKIDMKQSTTRNKLNLPMPHNANRAYKQKQKNIINIVSKDSKLTQNTEYTCKLLDNF